MFLIPPWVAFVVAGLVSSFGLYRLYIAWTSNPEELAERKGLYGMSRRRHALYGIVYLILGAMLLASGFGYNPFLENPDTRGEPVNQPTNSQPVTPR